LTTDHGTINVKTAVELIGDRETSSNLRYKTGKNLKYPFKKVLEVTQPERFKLPKLGLNSQYVFAKEAHYFVYPKNYHHYASLFQNTYQHGGISMEEMLIPFVFLTPK
ncbi:MAG: two-component system response regulator, partial [Flavobacteriaceae bacterium]